ncbi:shikimate dehydrogenase [Lacticaseibacillus sp. N501-2]|uniref:shikimate dehydrogenase n=1 Tax=Lacticaseibacillus salsurae TaxID=3367729 RepID=UPI0038B369CC
MIDGHTKLYGLLAHPAAHSLSPAMHNFAFDQQQLNARYLAFDVTLATLPTAVDAIRALHIGGVNLSMPLKQAVIPLLDHVSDFAQKAHSVNTIVNRDGELYGYSTDGVGVVQALRTHVELPQAKVLIFGAGGAAESAALALSDAGVGQLTLCNRHVATAQSLAERLGGSAQALALADEDAVCEAVRIADVVINATSLGMQQQRALTPLPAKASLQADQVVLDMVYDPLTTTFLTQAQQAGVKTCLNGLSLLVAQGAASFELWTGKQMPVAQVEALLATLL